VNQYEEYGFTIPDVIKDELAEQSLTWMDRMEMFFAKRRVEKWQGLWLLKSDDMPIQ